MQAPTRTPHEARCQPSSPSDQSGAATETAGPRALENISVLANKSLRFITLCALAGWAEGEPAPEHDRGPLWPHKVGAPRGSTGSLNDVRPGCDLRGLGRTSGGRKDLQIATCSEGM
jgi:hypothetical protein